MGIGIELYAIVAVGTLLVFVILWGIPRFVEFTKARRTMTYRATCLLDENKFDELTGLFRKANLSINSQSISKQEKRMICAWQVYGAPDSHTQVMHSFITDPEVIEFDVT